MGPCPTNVSKAECRLTKVIVSAFDASASLRTIVLSSRRKPWVSTELRALLRTGDCAYRIARISGTAAELQSFRAARARASNALDSAKNRYIISRLEEAASPEANGENSDVSVCPAPALPRSSAIMMQQLMYNNSTPSSPHHIIRLRQNSLAAAAHRP